MELKVMWDAIAQRGLIYREQPKIPRLPEIDSANLPSAITS
jgi:hypothetical protein